MPEKKYRPLADELRPTELDDVVGQNHILGKGGLLRRIIESGEIRLLEVNLNCNLWSEKVFGRAAIAAGFSQADLIETIVSESMIRQLVGFARRDAA